MVTSISVHGVYTILTSNFLNISPPCFLLLLGHNFLAWGQQIILLGFHILKLMAHLFSCFKELFVWLNPLLNKTTQYMATPNGSYVRLQFTPLERDLGEQYCFDTLLSLLSLHSDLWLCSFVLILTIWRSFKLERKNKINVHFVVLKRYDYKKVEKDLRDYFIVIKVQS